MPKHIPTMGMFASRKGNLIALQAYFNDLYAVFNKKLATFAISGEIEQVTAVRLKEMLAEIIRVRKEIINL